MRRRILQATIAAVTVAVILLGFPLAFFGAQFVRENDLQELDARAQTVASIVDFRLEQGIDPRDSWLKPYVGGGGSLVAHVRVVAQGTILDAGPNFSGRTVSASYTSDSGAIVILTVPWWDLFWLSSRVVALVVAAAIVAFAAGIAMAIWQANRLTAPLVYLAASAEQLGSGQVRPHLEASGVEEIDLVAAELGRSSDRMAERLSAERQFASDASHQLRTPLTALSMRLEEISAASDNELVRDEARISLEQVERLVTVVDDLLMRSRRAQGGTTEPLYVLDVVHQQQEEWTPSFVAAGRDLQIDVDPQAQVLATPGALAQVLATLLENSLVHGDGVTTVRSRPSGPGGGLVLEVGDQGVGVPDELAPRIFEREVTSGKGTGLGLALARDLVAADGGRLELAQRRPAVFAVFLAGAPHLLDPELVAPRTVTDDDAAPEDGEPRRRRGWFGRRRRG